MAKTKQMWTGTPPKKDFHPPKYRGKLSDNTVNMRKMHDAYGYVTKVSQKSREWWEELGEWREKIAAINPEIDLGKKSILEMEKIHENLLAGKPWDYCEKVEKEEDNDDDRIRSIVASL